MPWHSCKARFHHGPSGLRTLPLELSSRQSRCRPLLAREARWTATLKQPQEESARNTVPCGPHQAFAFCRRDRLCARLEPTRTTLSSGCSPSFATCHAPELPVRFGRREVSCLLRRTTEHVAWCAGCS